MPPNKRSIDEYDSDEETGVKAEVSPPKSKKSKNTSATGAKADGKDNEGNPFWELSSGRNPRRVGISEFKNSQLVNIREFYEKDGNLLHGKKRVPRYLKGISLTIDQYKNLLKAIPKINANLRDIGVDIGTSADAELPEDEESEEETKPAKKSKGKTSKKLEKSNIESTSDEDGE
ncbi:hypothetical protein F5884DRAFT_745313 [Xylogone sp. PMI_703]|nr:hypothetical protein F5884DRAFT_745313 [Xylogone sp. PMI_703]